MRLCLWHLISWPVCSSLFAKAGATCPADDRANLGRRACLINRTRLLCLTIPVSYHTHTHTYSTHTTQHGSSVHLLQDHQGYASTPQAADVIAVHLSDHSRRRDPVHEALREREDICLLRHQPSEQRPCCSYRPVTAHVLIPANVIHHRPARHPQTPRREAHRHPRRLSG